MSRRKRTSSALVKASTEGTISVPVEESVIDEVYNKIRGLQRDATLDLAINMGKIIVETFYEGRLDAWRTHGQKEVSLRKLAERFEEEESGISAAGIYRAVAIYELDQRLNVSARKQLSVTHVRAVLGLPPADQKRLLDLAEQKG